MAIVAAPVVGWFQRWNIYDAWRLYGYNPPAKIEQLARDASFNESTKRLYYANHPELLEKQQFSDNCKSAERTIVLGCFVPGMGIYIFNVQDARLEGVLQVTAAHEALHAGYQRLSPGDKERVDAMLNEVFTKLTNQRIKDSIADYKKRGADTTNELHSILGTEVRDLPADLEEYYKRYFVNRSKVVGYSEKYEQAFNERKQKIADFDKRLEALRLEIEAGERDLDNDENTLQIERGRLEAQLAANDTRGYNAGVAGFNALVGRYNRKVGSLRGLIEEFNNIVAQRNAIAVEENELVKAIDSRPDAIKQ